MSVQAVFRAALRDVVSPAARAEGFKGSAPNWRMVDQQGDWAIVNVQSSTASTSETLRCTVNLSVAPAPWLEWSYKLLGHRPKAVSEADGLYRGRLHSTGRSARRDGWWEVGSEREALAVAADIVEKLAADGWPLLRRLLDRETLAGHIQAGELGLSRTDGYDEYFVMAELLVRCQSGPSPRLDELVELLERTGERTGFLDWVCDYAGLPRGRSRPPGSGGAGRRSPG
ncbi:DUF4304 domain-containing protein [Lentzea alba]|uniref:DUF4304 domain-containing protein n=1 Tax=Lentzea alba TaxID=2714351 RepID=UPI0039BF94CB